MRADFDRDRGLPSPPCATTTISAILAPTLDPPRATSFLRVAIMLAARISFSGSPAEEGDSAEEVDKQLGHKERLQRGLTTQETGVHEDEYEDDFEMHTTRLPAGNIQKAKTLDGKSNTWALGKEGAAEDSEPQTPERSVSMTTPKSKGRGTIIGGITMSSSGGLGSILRATSEGMGMIMTKSLSQWTRNDSDKDGRQTLTTANFTRAPM